MANDEFFPKTSTINFTIRNISPQRKKLTVFGCPIELGATRDLLALPNITEADIRNSLVKGELYKRVKNGDITVVSSSIDLLQYDSSQKAFLQSAGVTSGLEVGGSSLATNSIPDSAVVTNSILGSYVNAPAWSAQATWHVNAITGNDTNDGLTSNTALKTVGEWHRRTSNDFPRPAIVTLYLDSDIPITDQLKINQRLRNTNLQIIGKTTQVATGTFTAVRATNRSANQELQVTAAAFTFTGHEGKVIRMTSGPNAGAISMILKVISAHVIRCCKFSAPNIGIETFYNNIYAGFVEPAGTETFELLTTISLDETPTIDTGDGDWSSAIAMFFVRFGGSNDFAVGKSIGSGFVQLFGCGLENGYFEISGSGVLNAACCYVTAVVETGNASKAKFSACGFTPNSYLAAYNSTSMVVADEDSIFQDGSTIYSLYGATIQTNNVCVLDCSFDFIIVESLCSAILRGAIYGSGNTNNIISLGNSQSRVIYENAALFTATSTQPVVQFTGITKGFNELPFIYTVNGNAVTLA